MERGLYPGLPTIVGLLCTLRTGEPDWQNADDGGLVAEVRRAVKDEEEMLGTVFDLLNSKGKPEYLSRCS